MKKCCRCHSEKEESEFPKQKNRKDGLSSYCKQCNKLRVREWENKNYEKSDKRRKLWRKLNSKKVVSDVNEWRKENPEKHKAIAKKYYEKHREEILIKKKIWNEQHPEYLKQWYEKNKIKRIRRPIQYSNTRSALTKRKYEKLHPDRALAHQKVTHLIKSGKILKSSNCILCGKECKTEAHHPDYSKPLDVMWICRKCHIDIHYKKKIA